MIVIIIVGVLAATTLYKRYLPHQSVYTGFRKKAHTSEASASLGAIKTAENVYYREKGCYTADWSELGMAPDGFAHNQWFLPGCFGLTGSCTHFTAWCNGNNGKEQAKGIYLKLTHDGKVEACMLADIIAAEPTYVP
jgi:type II secretory pathway pseudopilin PulG